MSSILGELEEHFKAKAEGCTKLNNAPAFLERFDSLEDMFEAIGLDTKDSKLSKLTELRSREEPMLRDELNLLSALTKALSCQYGRTKPRTNADSYRFSATDSTLNSSRLSIARKLVGDTDA